MALGSKCVVKPTARKAALDSAATASKAPKVKRPCGRPKKIAPSVDEDTVRSLSCFMIGALADDLTFQALVGSSPGNAHATDAPVQDAVKRGRGRPPAPVVNLFLFRVVVIH